MEQYGIRFMVPFVAAKHRPRHTLGGHTYTEPKDIDHMEDIAEAFYKVAQEQGFRNTFPLDKDQPVSVYISVFKPLAKNTKKSIKSKHYVQKPDVDNIAKLVLDGLNGYAYEDDKQVTQLHVSKADREREINEGIVVSIRWQKL